MRVLLLVNPTASSVTPRKRRAIRRILASEHDVEVAETSRRGHAKLLAHAAARDGFDVVAVYAGDGTLNEAASGLLHTDTALAPLPGGSTNVYSETLGYPRHADDSARALLGALAHDSVKRVGVGMTNDRPFLFCTGIGFDASVIRRVERHSRRLKRMASHPLHIAAAFHTFVSADGRAVRVDIDVDANAGGANAGGGAGASERISGVRFGIVSKTSPYTHLGRLPLHVNRNAGLDTRLSLTAFTQLRALSLIGGAVSSIRTGKFLHERKDVVQLDDISALHVRSEAPFPYQVDGDDVGDTTELRIALEPDALTIALPPPAPHRERS
jgi:diacylglycerol kinase family enzyme